MTFKINVDEGTRPLTVVELTRTFNKIAGYCIDCKRSKFTKEYDCEDCMTKEKLKDLIEDAGGNHMTNKQSKEFLYTSTCVFCGVSPLIPITIDRKKLNTVSKRDKFRKKLKKELLKEHYPICEQARVHFSTEKMRGLCD